MSNYPEWPGKLTRSDAIRLIDRVTDQDDPYWSNLVDDHYDENTDTMPTIFHVFAALGVSEEEYKAVTGAGSVKWPKPRSPNQPHPSSGDAKPIDGII